MDRTVAVGAAAAPEPRSRAERTEELKEHAARYPVTRSEYEPETIERALMELALCGGRATIASRRLEDAGIKVPSTTLQQWARVPYSDRYAELAATVAKDLEKKIAAEAEAYIMRAAEVELNILEKLAARAESDDADAVTLSNALRNVSVSKGIAMDKVASPIRGRPTVIQGTPDNFDQLLARLDRLGVKFAQPEVVEGTAHELPPGESSSE